jgi:hypothetical protein
MPYVVKNLKEAKEKLDHMHDVKSSPTDMNITKNKKQEQEVIELVLLKTF